MRLIGSISILLLALSGVENANILGLFPLPSFSHFVMFKRILETLAEKGHNVDVVSHFPRKTPLPGYKDISLAGSMPIFVNNLTLEQMPVDNVWGGTSFLLNEGGVDLCKILFDSSVVKDLKNTKKKYDLLLVELFGSDCFWAFGPHFNIPMVALTSSVHLPWGSDRIGLPDNPSYIPTYFSPYSADMTLAERVMNTFYYIQAKLMYKFMSENPSNKEVRKFFGPTAPDLDEVIKNVSLLMVNSHFSTNQARPVVPNFIEIAGVHIKEPQPLSQHFEEIMQHETGIVYFSTGSMMLTETFPLHKLQALCDAFKEIPYKILWKATREKFPKELIIPDNVHFEPWMPQLDILCHPNTKLFITHGGLMGSQEAIHCGVPRLGIPLFADQELNIRQSQAMGLALRVGYAEISKEKLSTALKELLGNPKYLANARIVSKRFKDRPQSALEAAIYWLEYVIRHNGAPHLRSKGADLAWYQYFLLDVACIVFVVLYVIGKGIKLLYKLVTNKDKLKTA